MERSAAQKHTNNHENGVTRARKADCTVRHKRRQEVEPSARLSFRIVCATGKEFKVARDGERKAATRFKIATDLWLPMGAITHMPCKAFTDYGNPLEQCASSRGGGVGLSAAWEAPRPRFGKGTGGKNEGFLGRGQRCSGVGATLQTSAATAAATAAETASLVKAHGMGRTRSGRGGTSYLPCWAPPFGGGGQNAIEELPRTTVL
eukprot:RCo028000